LNRLAVQKNVITIEQKYDPEDASEALYAANFALGISLPLIDGLLGANNAHKYRHNEQI